MVGYYINYNFVVEDRFDDFKVTVSQTEAKLSFQCNCASNLFAGSQDHGCCPHSAASLIMLSIKYEEERDKASNGNSKFAKKEMIKRVLKERQEKRLKKNLKLF